MPTASARIFQYIFGSSHLDFSGHFTARNNNNGNSQDVLDRRQHRTAAAMPFPPLSPELRIAIYELVFEPDVTFFYGPTSVFSHTGIHRMGSLGEAILRTCRAVYHEALPIFEEITMYHFEHFMTVRDWDDEYYPTVHSAA
jgi:hypothetical protein